MGRRETRRGKNTERELTQCPPIWGASLDSATALSPAWLLSSPLGCGILWKGRSERRPKWEVGERTAEAPAAPNKFKPLGLATHPRDWEYANEAGNSCGDLAGILTESWQTLEGLGGLRQALWSSLPKRGLRWVLQTREGNSMCRLRKILEETINEGWWALVKGS